MTCELCGEMLRVESDGQAHCTNCGMTYTLDYLREKSTGTKPAPRPKAKSKNFDSQYRMARAAIRQGSTSKAVAICDEILSVDYEDLTAWEIKIQALCDPNDPYAAGRIGEAADCFCDACESAKDPSERSRFIDRLKPVFMEHLNFNDNTPTVAQNFVAIDAKLAEEYLRAVFNEKKSSLKRSCNDAVSTVEEYRKEAGDDYRYYSLMASEVKRAKSWMSKYVDWAELIWQSCGQKCHIAKPLYDFICPIRDALRKIDSSNQSAERLLTKIQQVAEAQEKEAQRIATENFWAENADMKERLTQKMAELHQERQDLLRLKSACENDPQHMQMAQKVSDLTAELSSVGFFDFKRKKELKEVLAANERILQEIVQNLSLQKENLQKQLDGLKQQQNEVQQKLTNPLGFK